MLMLIFSLVMKVFLVKTRSKETQSQTELPILGDANKNSFNEV